MLKKLNKRALRKGNQLGLGLGLELGRALRKGPPRGPADIRLPPHCPPGVGPKLTAHLDETLTRLWETDGASMTKASWSACAGKLYNILARDHDCEREALARQP